MIPKTAFCFPIVALWLCNVKAADLTFWYQQCEFFCGHPAGVMAIHSTADKPTVHTGSIELCDSHGAEIFAKGSELTFSGALTNGLKYDCRLAIVPDGGSVLVDGSMLTFTNCNGFTLLMAKRHEYFTCPNFLGFHPPTQIDGDFGITAGICKMLSQSQDDELDLLPALRTERPTGSVSGLQARGGFVADDNRRDGKLISATIRSKFGGTTTIRYGKEVKQSEITPGQAVEFIPN